MLPKNKRIPRRLFPIKTDKTKVFRNNLFLLKIAVSEVLGSRFSFSVSKKVAKSAVVRNKLRRAGYRLLDKFLPKIKPGVLVTLSFKILPKDNKEIANGLEAILRESKLII